MHIMNYSLLSYTCILVTMSRPMPIEEMVRQFKERHAGSHLFKIDNFSLLKKHNIGKINSSTFNIGSNKWNLNLYPMGNENGNSSVSMYLQILDVGSLQVKVEFKLFVINQLRQMWHAYTGNVVFNATNTEWGFKELIPLATLDDNTKGYLVGDCVLFGVEIMHAQGAGAGTAECFTLIEKPLNNKATWKMTRFSTFLNHGEHKSHEFAVGNRKWRIHLYPRGMGEAQGKSLSVYLHADGYTDNALKTMTYAKFRLRVLNQNKGKHREFTVDPRWFTVEPQSWGFTEFMPLRDLDDASKGYKVNDLLYVGVEIDLVSMSTSC